MTARDRPVPTSRGVPPLHGGEIVREAGAGVSAPGEGPPRRLGDRGRRGQRTRDPRAPARGHARDPDAGRGVRRRRRATATGWSTPSTAPRTSSTASPPSASRSPWWRRAARSPGACTRRSWATPTWPPAARAPGSSATTSPRRGSAVERPARPTRPSSAPASRSAARRSLPRYLAAMSVALETFEDLRRPGAACLDLAWVAAGVFDGFFELAPRPVGRRRRRPPDRGSRRRRHRLDRRGRVARGRHPGRPTRRPRGTPADRHGHRPQLTGRTQPPPPQKAPGRTPRPSTCSDT